MVFGVRRGLRGASVPRWSALPRRVVSRRGTRPGRAHARPVIRLTGGSRRHQLGSADMYEALNQDSRIKYK